MNRVSLIGKDHNILVKFMSKMKIKIYIGITITSCLIISSIKFFKYRINHDQPEANYPMSNEWDIFASNASRNNLRSAYFIINMINDLLNNLLFVLICSGIDIYMVVRFRRTLEEKLEKSKSMNEGNEKLELKKKEFEEAIAKAVKMVVINTFINLLFKLPSTILPIINTYAQYYYKDQTRKYSHPTFGRFYSRLFDSGFYEFTIDLSDFLFLISISIQFFIYKKFDKKFRIGLKKLLKLIKSSSIFKKQSK